VVNDVGHRKDCLPSLSPPSFACSPLGQYEDRVIECNPLIRYTYTRGSGKHIELPILYH